MAAMEPHLPADSLSTAPDGPSTAARDEARAGLYVHVPFCATRCTYCDFSSGALSHDTLERYLNALAIEVPSRAESARGTRFTSVFFGGGTPSALASRHFAAVMRLLRDHFEIANGAEITLEANPESVRPALLDAWAAGGVNRLSMGAQSFDPGELAKLGRIHSVDRPAEAVRLARTHGFGRLSLDLMFGFPEHTPERFAATLDRALACGVEHLSAYCFIPEPGTPLGDAALSGRAALPSAEEQADLYESLTLRVSVAGMSCYETSNFCRPGAEARHNVGYWLRRPYLGLGPSAHSLLGGLRFGNHYAAARWAEALERGASPESERETESDASVAEEIVMLGLRLGNGLIPRDYAAKDWNAVRGRYGAALDHAVAASRLERTSLGWRVPRRLRFVADECIAWVAARERRPIRRPVWFDTASAVPIMIEPCSSLPSPAI
ncbi:MAG: radical SAM family heme chaperone HemW [Candidatus Eisenbacteria bacterium]|nr:radical SAM family heme chaperone HemW [Candidatus Eisenbacteria bacterium]